MKDFRKAFANKFSNLFPIFIKMRLISQLIKGVSRVFQKLLKHFNGTIISNFFVPLSPVTLVIFCLNLNEAPLSAV